MSLNDDLVAYWKLNEESGTRVDSVGSNDLADNNTVLYGTGKIGNAADFEDTQSEFLDIADNADLSTGDIDFSGSIWVNIESGGLAHIIGKGEETPDTIEWWVWLGGDNKPNFAISDDGDVMSDIAAWGSALTVDGSTWYHIAFYHDATGDEIGIIVNDGTPVTTATGGDAPTDRAGPFQIGFIDGTTYFDGLIDEAGFWKKVLSSAEITALYNNGDGLTYPFPVSLAGPFVATGTVAKKGTRSLAGPLVLTGTVAKKGKRALAGALALTGTIVKKGKKALAGALVLTGVLAKSKLWILFARFHDYFLTAPQRFAISSNKVQMTARYHDYYLTGPEKK